MSATDTQAMLNYHRIAAAIEYIRDNFRKQPALEEIAEHVHLSPFHFQRLFTEWAGTSPKKFLQYLSLEHAKRILRKEEGSNLFNTAFETGLSGTGRLHDLFIKIEGMTPAEYKQGGMELRISYSMEESPFGPLMVASTHRGICYMAFHENDAQALAQLRFKFPGATFVMEEDELQRNALQVFRGNWENLPEIKLHLKASGFQLKVWEALLKIPLGQLCSYGSLARSIGYPGGSRAVGTAVGSNPVAYLIPCHRVIQASGAIGGYMWGSTRKAAIIGWEGAQADRIKEASKS